jgi:hypothetical protein
MVKRISYHSLRGNPRFFCATFKQRRDVLCSRLRHPLHGPEVVVTEVPGQRTDFRFGLKDTKTETSAPRQAAVIPILGDLLENLRPADRARLI